MPFVAIYDNYLNFVDFNNFTANSYKKDERMVHDPSLTMSILQHELWTNIFFNES